MGATFESPDGVVLVDKTYCLGCRYCVQACPYGCRFIDPRTKTVDKCSLCYHRITKGLTTACCETCPTEARVLGDLKNPKDPIHEFLRTHKVQVLKPQMATGLEGLLQRPRRLGPLACAGGETEDSEDATTRASDAEGPGKPRALRKGSPSGG